MTDLLDAPPIVFGLALTAAAVGATGATISWLLGTLLLWHAFRHEPQLVVPSTPAGYRKGRLGSE